MIEDARFPQAYDISVDFYFDHDGVLETVPLEYQFELKSSD